MRWRQFRFLQKRPNFFFTDIPATLGAVAYSARGSAPSLLLFPQNRVDHRQRVFLRLSSAFFGVGIKTAAMGRQRQVYEVDEVYEVHRVQYVGLDI
jgi:hypothetical protein